MSEMIERVARALYLNMVEPNMADAEAFARIAIEAMREPTEKMLLQPLRGRYWR